MASGRCALLLPFHHVEGDRVADDFFERSFLNRIVFPDVDCPSGRSLEAGIEETSGVLQRGPVKEGQLDDLLVGFARTTNEDRWFGAPLSCEHRDLSRRIVLRTRRREGDAFTGSMTVRWSD